MNVGDTLNRIVNASRSALFDQGELAQLTYGAFDVVATNLMAGQSEQITISYPIGYRPDRTTVQGSRTYGKDELLGRYQFLAFEQLAINGIVQLVTLVEAMLGDVLRVLVAKYPRKLGGKRNIAIEAVLRAGSLEEVHLRATDALINEWSYLAPAEFAEAIEKVISIDLRECPAFHRYIEVKATRDINIHNRGIANEIYARKTGGHARVTPGKRLPVDIPYFLEAYEACLQLTEWLEEELHQQWHSPEFVERRVRMKERQKLSSGDGAIPPPALASAGVSQVDNDANKLGGATGDVGAPKGEKSTRRSKTAKAKADKKGNVPL